MNADKKIAIIIINWKKYDLTLNCIDSVLKSSYKNFKIILIDNESQNNFPDEINKSDSLSKVKFEKLHWFSVLINILQIVRKYMRQLICCLSKSHQEM